MAFKEKEKLLTMEEWRTLHQILHHWFSQGRKRGGPAITPGESGTHPALWDLAMRIYKRGYAPSVAPGAPWPTTHCIALPQLPQPPPGVFLVLDRALQAQGVAPEGPWVWEWSPSEDLKNLTTLQNLLTAIPPNAQELWAFGGGATLDLAGFGAWWLGLPFSGAPTTLLAAVDAGLGGKVGVNAPPFGKNQIGAFWPMDTLWVVPPVFSTLTTAQRAQGLAEAAKHSWLFGSFEDERPQLQNILEGVYREAELEAFIFKHLAYKSQVVAKDPLETLGCRVGLNFGHTLGHVFETLSQEGYTDPLAHGFAVALGMVALEPFAPGKNPDFFKWLSHHFGPHLPGLPLGVKQDPHLLKNRIYQLLLQDKKNTLSTPEDEVSCVLPRYGIWKNGVCPMPPSPIPVSILQKTVLRFMEVNKERESVKQDKNRE